MNVTSITSEDGVKEYEQVAIEPEEIEYTEVGTVLFLHELHSFPDSG